MFLHTAHGTCNYTSQNQFSLANSHNFNISTSRLGTQTFHRFNTHPPTRPNVQSPNSPSIAIGAKHLLQVPSRHLSIQSGEHTSKGHDVLAACQNHTSTSEAVRLWSYGSYGLCGSIWVQCWHAWDMHCPNLSAAVSIRKRPKVNMTPFRRKRFCALNSKSSLL